MDTSITQKLENVAKSLSSKGSAFLFASLGVITQTAHNGLISFELSSFEGILKYVQAGVMAAFLSFALLFFTLTATKEELEKPLSILNIFFIFEVILNLYYWTNKNIILTDTPDYYSILIYIPLSLMIPYAIKEYAKSFSGEEVLEKIYVEDVIKEKTELEKQLEGIKEKAKHRK